MNYYRLPAYLAEGYGCHAYGQTAGYSSCTLIGQSSQSSQGPSSQLQNTGVPILVSTAVSVTLIVAAVIIFKLRKK